MPEPILVCFSSRGITDEDSLHRVRGRPPRVDAPPPDRGCELQDALSMADLLAIPYTSRWCHNMIPLSVNVLAHPRSTCAHASAMSPRFRHLRSCTKWCDYLPV